MKENLEADSPRVKRPRRGLLAVGLAMTVVVLGMALAYQRAMREGERLGRPVVTPASTSTEGAVGTSGTRELSAVEGHEDPSVMPPAIIQELDTITGSVDGQQLIGRRVDLHATVQAVPNDAAFWIGAGDNRLLVRLRRDNRDGRARQLGPDSHHAISPVHVGQQATISGSVQPLPEAGDMSTWRLTQRDYAELLDRKLYIRADTVTTNGHGTHGANRVD